MLDEPLLVPEPDTPDLDRSVSMTGAALGVDCDASRPGKPLAYPICEWAYLMLEAAAGPGGRFGTAHPEYPLAGKCIGGFR